LTDNGKLNVLISKEILTDSVHMPNTNEQINALKVEIFDILQLQARLQQESNKLEQAKGDRLKAMDKLLEQLKAENVKFKEEEKAPAPSKMIKKGVSVEKTLTPAEETA
jgi:vacuolar-type H+-ATPase subunit I/STV1